MTTSNHPNRPSSPNSPSATESAEPPRVLVVDDEPEMGELIRAALALHDIEVAICRSASAAIDAIDSREFDVVMTDVRMPGSDGLELCGQVVAKRPALPVIVMTAFGSMETVIAALRAGAYDFVTKPFEMDVLAAAVRRAIEHRRLRREVRRLKEFREHPDGFGEMIGESPAMRRLYSQLGRIAAADTSVLITGESGTGKELVARSIHNRSRRAEAKLVAVNCAALSETLLESELFGHARGAFTDAKTEREGLFVSADRGTLLLDEMGDMPLPLQVKLLRALEERRVRPVGGSQEISFDVRVLAATHRDLETAVSESRFREDLFYRINVIQLHLPPLRARGTDVLLIADHFVKSFAAKNQANVDGITSGAAERLLTYSWPGNIRELRNVIERAVALTPFDKITVEDLPEKIRNHRSRSVVIGGDDPAELVSLEEIERRYIDHVLDTVNQNKTLASQILGLDRKTLYRKLKKEEAAE